MALNGPLDFLPLWALLLATLAITFLSVEIGFRVGRHRVRRAAGRETEAPVGALVGAELGLLGFLLAFTFGLAATRFEARRDVLLRESNAIGTTWLRAGMLPEQGEEIRDLLRRYVDARMEAVRTLQIDVAVQRSNELQNQLWSRATELATKHPNSIVVGLFVQTLNDVIDIHAERMQLSLRNRIPLVIWLTLYGVAVMSLGVMGYHGGLAGPTRSLAIGAVVVTFSVVIILIADLDRPGEGMLQVSQQAMIDLRNSMGLPAPAASQP